VSLRLPIKHSEKEFYHKLFALLQKSVTYAKKDIHFENAKELFKDIKNIPQLREFGGENMSNKQLSLWIIQQDNTNNNQRTSGNDLLSTGMPNLS
jgi:hypothetical protein